MALKFDKQGCLKIYDINNITHANFKIEFVDSFKSENRQNLYKSYLFILTLIKKELSLPFYVIIYGSFVRKNKEPNDIDVIFLIHPKDYCIYKESENYNLLKNKVFQNRVDVYDIMYYIKKGEAYRENFLDRMKDLKEELLLWDADRNLPTGVLNISYS